MSVQYIAPTRRFRVTYKDFSKSAEKNKTVYSSVTMYFQDEAGNDYVPAKKPTKGMISARLAELREVESKMEEESKKGLVKTTDNSNVESAGKLGLVYQLGTLVKNKATRNGNPQTERKAKRIVADFAAYLQMHHPDVTADTLKRSVCLDYLGCRYGDKMLNSMVSAYQILKTAINIIIEEHEINAKNVFCDIHTYNLAPMVEGEKLQKDLMAFDSDWMRGFWGYLNNGNIDAQVRVAIYLVMVTGWRVGDVCALAKDNIDLTARVIILKHAKTKKKTGQRTAIYITDAMMAQIEPLFFASNNGRLFKLAPSSLHSKITKTLNDYFEAGNTPIGYKVTKINGANHKTHNIHSFRKSAITLLKMAGYDSERVRYLTGHAGASVEEMHYNTFAIDPKSSTKPMLEHMDGIINGQDRKKADKERLLEILSAAGFSIGDVVSMFAS